ncbi:hypothetical protein F511_09026 [Dorcoceras hygrometricum]|uniref:Uncharacterized protein n=1 Tax=Dorcoceras hygrometricum TaxID=472368 RepID=A0A2Z7CL06_9LAMI|nr:hypothetical protein F511_09026 [Dorcoceras hygrometricum]
MVSTPGKQSQEYGVQLSLVLEKLVKADLGESMALHHQKVLNTKSVHTYLKKNEASIPTSIEGSKISRDRAVGAAEPKKKLSVKTNKTHATVAESTLVKVTVAPAGGIGISRYGDISVTHEDLLALVRIEVAAGRHRA